MLEFYTMPTNASGLYPHHQNHGGARFLDNPATASAAVSTVLPSAGSPHSNGNNSSNPSYNNSNQMTTQILQHQQQLQEGISGGMMTSGMLHMPEIPANPNNNDVKNHASLSASSSSGSPSSATSPSSGGGVGGGGAALSTLTISLSATMGLCDANGSSTTTNLPPSTVNSATPHASSALHSVTGRSATAVASANTSTTIAISPVASAPSSASSTPTAASTASTTSTVAITMAASSSKLPVDCSGRTDVGHIKCEKNYEICEGCGQKIHDRYLMNVGDANWHEQCLACCYCGMQLHNTCYVRNTKLYCKVDYDRLFGIKCSACCHPVLPHDMVMRPIPNYIFHLSCFMCYACSLPLQKGEQFMLRDGQLFCFRHDLEKEMYLAAAAAAQHCGFVGLDEDDLLRPRDGRRGPKRPRTILTSQQRKQFKASFDQSPKPCRKVREALAKDTGLSVRVVQVWFQNQRAKMKKIQRKAKNGNNGGSGGNRGGGGSGGNNNCEDKELSLSGGKEGKDDKCLGDAVMGGAAGGDNSYLSLESAFSTHHQPLNPNLPFSPDDYPANSNDSFCSSDLSMDGSNFDQLDDDTDSLSLNNLELHSTSSSGNHQHHSGHGGGCGGGVGHHPNPHEMIANLNSSLINPIDKLYLMQNSYFNSEQ